MGQAFPTHSQNRFPLGIRGCASQRGVARSQPYKGIAIRAFANPISHLRTLLPSFCGRLHASMADLEARTTRDGAIRKFYCEVPPRGLFRRTDFRHLLCG